MICSVWYISPTGGAANVPFVRRWGKMHKWASLSAPPFHTESHTAVKFTISLDMPAFYQTFYFIALSYSVAEKLRVKLWKKRRKSQNWQRLGTYISPLGKKLQKSEGKMFLILPSNNRHCARFIWLYPVFSNSLLKTTTVQKIEKFDWLPGIGPRNFAEI